MRAARQGDDTRVERKWEIGGYLELERFGGRLFHENALRLNSGRGCIAYLIEAEGIQSALLPDYMCDAVSQEFSRLNVAVETYHVNEVFEPDWLFSVKPGQWLYLNDYYGQLTDDCVWHAKEVSAGRLVVDETQGFFTLPRPGIRTLYTCRKYFGVPDGGFLYTPTLLQRKLDRDVSWKRMKHVLGRFEEGSAQFLPIAQENNDVFSTHGARQMSALTENLLRGIDYESAMRKRTENYEVLADALDVINPLSLSIPNGPFAYPLLVGDGAQARKTLAKHGVFVPILWPNVPMSNNASQTAKQLAMNILPLPIDQRYGAEEMNHILSMLFDEGII